MTGGKGRTPKSKSKGSSLVRSRGGRPKSEGRCQERDQGSQHQPEVGQDKPALTASTASVGGQCPTSNTTKSTVIPELSAGGNQQPSAHGTGAQHPLKHSYADRAAQPPSGEAARLSECSGRQKKQRRLQSLSEKSR